MTRYTKTLRRHRRWGLLALPVLAAALVFGVIADTAAGQEGGGETLVPDAKFTVTGSFLVNNALTCAVSGNLDVFLGPVSPPPGEFGLDSQPFTLAGKLSVDCGLPSTPPSTFQVTGSGTSTEQQYGVTASVGTPFDVSSMIHLTGFCESLGEACDTGNGLQLACLDVTDPNSMSCNLAAPGVVKSTSGQQFTVNSGNIDLSGIGPTATATPTPTPTPIKPGDVPLGGGGVYPEVLGAGGSSGADYGIVAGLLAALALGGAAWYARRRLRQYRRY